MHRPIATVFKVLGISIVLMMILDISFIIIDTVTVHNRVTSYSSVIQDELVRHNAIPDDIAGLFEENLNSVVERSNIATNIEWNLNNSMTVDGETYPPINEANVKDYGEQITLAIRVTYEPHSLILYRDPSLNEGSFLGRSLFSYDVEYTETVPALRYLK